MGRSGGVKGGLLDPYRSRFAPLEALQGIGFGPKHHIMVQLVNVYRVGITGPFQDLGGSPRGFQKENI